MPLCPAYQRTVGYWVLAFGIYDSFVDFILIEWLLRVNSGYTVFIFSSLFLLLAHIFALYLSISVCLSIISFSISLSLFHTLFFFGYIIICIQIHCDLFKSINRNRCFIFSPKKKYSEHIPRKKCQERHSILFPIQINYIN